MAQLPSGTVTTLFTDIEGSTGLLQRLGTEAYHDQLDLHRQLLRKSFARHHGCEVEMQGDSFHVAFARASDAVAAAAELQRVLAEAEWPAGDPIRVRVGIHTGEPRLDGRLYVGLDIHRAARVMQAAHGGQTLLSQSTRDLVDVPLRDLGEHRLKDLLEPVRLYQLGEGDFPPLDTFARRHTNLPVQPTPLVGREGELAELEGVLARNEARLVTLTGPGGTGKTRLAPQAAAGLLDAFPSGVWFVNLAALTDPELVMPTIAQTLGLKEQPGEPLAKTLTRSIGPQKLLLVLDNFEQVVDAAPALAELIAETPQLVVLATNRSPLHLRGECEYAVSPLAPEDALALFAQRAQGVKAGFRLNGNRSVVAEICRRLDDLPLAIELAAAWIKVLPEQALLERLNERLRLLTGGARDLPERQRTLRAAIDWSYALLSETEQTLFARLAVFRGGRTLDSVESVCDADGTLDAFGAVASLVDKSLLRQETSEDGGVRFVMLETIHEYAWERLEATGDADRFRRRHAEHFLALAEEAEPDFLAHDQVKRWRQFDAELENVRAALEWALAVEPVLALRLASALDQYWDVTGKSSEALRWLQSALARTPGAGHEIRAKALLAAGTAAFRMSDLPAAERLLEESRALFRTLGSPGMESRCLSWLAGASYQRGDSQRAETLGTEALALASGSDDPYALGAALNFCGFFPSERGDYARARALFEESADVHERAGNARDANIARVNIGEALLNSGDAEGAGSMMIQLLDELARLGDAPLHGYALRLAGLALLEQGKVDDAAAALREAVALARRAGLHRDLIDCLVGFGGIAEALGRPSDAVRLWGATEAALEVASHTLFAIDRLVYERHLARTREQVLADEWKAAWAEGRKLTVEQALAAAEVKHEPVSASR